jgi:hypothetical protein
MPRALPEEGERLHVHIHLNEGVRRRGVTLHAQAGATHTFRFKPFTGAFALTRPTPDAMMNGREIFGFR